MSERAIMDKGKDMEMTVYRGGKPMPFTRCQPRRRLLTALEDIAAALSRAENPIAFIAAAALILGLMTCMAGIAWLGWG